MNINQKHLLVEGLDDFLNELSEFFLGLEGYRLVFIKTQTPHFPADFPFQLPIGKDVDIFVLDQDYDGLIQEVKGIQCPSGISKYIVEKQSNFRVRFERDLRLVLQIDVSKNSEYVSQKFVQGAIQRSKKEGRIAIPDTPDEMVFRVADLLYRPLKKHHHSYILRNYLKLFSINRSELSGPLRMACSLLRIPILGFPLFVFTSPAAIKRLKSYFSKYLFFTERHPTHVLQVELATLFLRQFNDSGFARMDSIVRLLALEESKGLNSVGFSMYDKMQNIRSRGFNDGSIDRFKTLINQMSEKGYDPYSTIIVNRAGGIVDGSHRFASAMYFKEKMVPINRPFKSEIKTKGADFGIDWFQKSGFTSEELSLMNSRVEELVVDLNAFFHAIIWGPARSFKDEIQDFIAQDHKVIEVIELDVTNNLKEFVSEVYACDDIEEWKIQRKTDSFITVDPKVTIVKFFISDPKFRRKAMNGHLISQTVERLKFDIRQRFMSKVDNYIYDNIIHIEDNFDHSMHMETVIQKYLPLG